MIDFEKVGEAAVRAAFPQTELCYTVAVSAGRAAVAAMIPPAVNGHCGWCPFKYRFNDSCTLGWDLVATVGCRPGPDCPAGKEMKT